MRLHDNYQFLMQAAKINYKKLTSATLKHHRSRHLQDPSTSLEYTSLAERTTRLHETTRDENVNKDGGELPGRHLQSTWSVFETPAKRTRMRAKSLVHRESKSMRQRV